MEPDPISILSEALTQCAEAQTTVCLVVRCAVSKLPEEQRERLYAEVAENEQITLEEAELKLGNAATAISMTNADPAMGSNALLSMFSELNAMQGNLSADVLRVDEQRLQAEKAKITQKIIIPGT